MAEQRPGFCEVGHRRVKLARFCGVVGLGERVLEILPKTQDGAGTTGLPWRAAADASTDRAIPAVPEHQAVGQHVRRAPLLEAFIAAFFDAVSALTRGGLLKQYLESADDLTVVRGRIAVTASSGLMRTGPIWWPVSSTS